MTNKPSSLNPHYAAAAAAIRGGTVRRMDELLMLISYTRTAQLLKLNPTAFKKRCLDCPGNFRVSELAALAKLMDLPLITLIDLVQCQLDGVKNTSAALIQRQPSPGNQTSNVKTYSKHPQTQIDQIDFKASQATFSEPDPQYDTKAIKGLKRGRKISLELVAEAQRLVLEEGLTKSEASRHLGITRSSLYYYLTIKA